jgi:hypothetical protein
MKTYDEIRQVIALVSQLDLDVTPYVDDAGEVHVCLNCNDTFFWGCADAEDIEAEDLPLLQQANDELTQVLGKYHNLADILFICKKRRMRPQGALYKLLPPKCWALLNACGPYRKVSTGNPEDIPNDDNGGKNEHLPTSA